MFEVESWERALTKRLGRDSLRNLVKTQAGRESDGSVPGKRLWRCSSGYRVGFGF